MHHIDRIFHPEVLTGMGRAAVEATHRMLETGATGFTLGLDGEHIIPGLDLRYWTAKPNFIVLGMPGGPPDIGFSTAIRTAVEQLMTQPLYAFGQFLGGWHDFENERLHIQAAVGWPDGLLGAAIMESRVARQRYVWDAVARVNRPVPGPDDA